MVKIPAGLVPHAARALRVFFYVLGASPVVGSIMSGQAVSGRVVVGAIVSALVAVDVAVVGKPS